MNRPILTILPASLALLGLFVFASCGAMWTKIKGICPSSCLCGAKESTLVVGFCSRENVHQEQLSEQIDSFLSSNLTYRYLPNGKLEQLWIISTPLTHVPRTVCRLTTIQTLMLSNSSLTRLPDNCLINLTALTSLTVEFIRITKLQDRVFDGLHKLEYLYLHNDDITELQDGIFEGLPMLDRLYLVNNRISSTGLRTFDGLSKLTALFLQSNNISELQDGIFDKLPMLKTLALNNNRISSIGSRVFGGSAMTHSLTYVNLSYNSIQTLDSWPIYTGIYQTVKIELRYNNVSRFTNTLRWKENCNMRRVHFDLLLDLNPIMMSISDLLRGWDTKLSSIWCRSPRIMTPNCAIIN